MGIILAIDPGNDTGWAFFKDGTLYRCGLYHPKDEASPPWFGVGKVIIERPEVYPADVNNYAKVNRLLSLAEKVGRYSEFYESRGCTISHTLPKAWKQQVPKDVHEERIRGRLSMLERASLTGAAFAIPASKLNNVIDAIGLGLWFAKAERERL